MFGVATDTTLAIACERRLGRIVDGASMFDLHRLATPAGSLKPSRPLSAVIALTDDDLWLLECRFWVVGFNVNRVLGRCPREGAVAYWRHRWWAWPDVWKAELSWPERASYIEGTLMAGSDADRLMGLLASDEFGRGLVRSAPTSG